MNSPVDAPTTPERPHTPTPSTPPRLQRVSLSAHRGQGILAGDFIKPDPVLTQQETRTYLLAELKRWLTGRICSHAREVSVSHPNAMDLVPYLSDGTWPAARLYTLLYIREASRADYEERFHLVGEWAAEVCADYLQGVRPFADLKDAEAIAVGFVCTDILPCGQTVDSFWNRSPFDPLRLAPCDVSAGEDEVVVEDDEEVVEEDEEDEEEPQGLDEQIEALTVSRLLTSDYVIPGWVIATCFGIVTVYAWTVAAALSMKKVC